MPRIAYELVDNGEENKGSNVSIGFNNEYYFYYPCDSTFKCTDYEIWLEKGVYKFEVYGASGGHYNDEYITSYRIGSVCFDQNSPSIKQNVKCSNKPGSAGAGGYTSGVIKLQQKTHAFISIGGHGLYGYKNQSYETPDCYEIQNRMEGGYNGGGYSSNFYMSSTNWGSGSGGGATDIRFEVNDVFHRVIVAGGGGGTDNIEGTLASNDDGSGGAGGGLKAQGFALHGVIDNEHIATQTTGFSFVS